MTASLPPVGSAYRLLLDAFYGVGTGASITEQQLWTKFLLQQGLDPATFNIANAPPTLLASFSTYVQGRYERDTSSVVLSPDEQVKRAVVFSCFDVLLEMLQAVQGTVAAQANTLLFYGKWQQAYTDLLRKVPIYTAVNTTPTSGASTQMTANTMQLPLDANGAIITTGVTAAQVKLGYGGITLQDLLDTVLATRNTANPIEYYTIVGPSTRLDIGQGTVDLANQLELKFFYHDANNIGLTVNTSVVRTDNSVDGGADSRWQPDNFNPTYGFATFAGTETSGTDAQLSTQLGNFIVSQLNPSTSSRFNAQGQFVSHAGQLFKVGTDQLFRGENIDDASNVTGNGLVIRNTVGIPWRSDTTSGSDNSAQQRRTELNAKLQQYIDNLQSARQTIRDTSTRMETSLTQSKDAISQMSDLLTSFIQSMQGLISAIFR